MNTKKLKKISSVVIASIGLAGSAIGIWSYLESRMIVEIGGEWTITDHVETGPFSGTTLEFRVFLTQEGNTFKGTGEKWSEDGKAVPPSRRTPLTIIGGMIKGKDITATFLEHGSNRETRGQFFWKLAGSDHLVGTYSTTSSKGSSAGTRIR